MTEPIRVPGDPSPILRAHLAGQLATREPGTTFGLVLPDDWKPKSPAHVLVADDGGPMRWPISSRPRMRITVYADGRTKARRIAGLCLGIVLSQRVEGIAQMLDPTAVFDARDPHTGGVLAFFTFAATVRTRVV